MTRDDIIAAQRILARMPAPQMQEALMAIAVSALDPDANGNDTAEVVYAELGKLGIHIP